MPTGTYSPDAIFKTSVTLKDTQIKRLPTAPVEIVPAPSAGLTLVCHNAILRSNFTGGAYTNISDLGFITIAENGGNGLILLADVASEGRDDLTGFLSKDDRTSYLKKYDNGSPPGAYVDGYGSSPSGVTSYLNVNISIFAVNAAGNFTGGNANNTLKIVLYYSIEDLT